MIKGIFNASSVALNDSCPTLPNVSGALKNWFQALTFGVVTKTVVGFLASEVMTTFECQGVFVPNPNTMEIYDRGERIWDSWTLFTEIAVDLKVDDVITYLEKQFRVKTVNPLAKYGVFSYLLIEDYTNVGPTESGNQ